MTHEKGPAIVLVVDDNALVLWGGIGCVEDLGYMTRSAGDAAGALIELDKLPAIDVLFTDIDMPGTMNGVGLAEEARRLDPGVGILITSGHSFPLTSKMPAGGIFLPKPYSSLQVHDALATMIDQARPFVC